MGTLYQIKNWDTNYENAKSRTINNPAHVYMTNKHDGLQFRKLIAKKDGAEIFAAFVLMAEICSKQAPPRQGYLSNDGTELGRPYTAEDLEFMTGLKAKAFEGAFQTLANDGFTWLSIPRYTQGILDKDTTSIPEYPLDRTEQNRDEQNITEQNSSEQIKFSPTSNSFEGITDDMIKMWKEAYPACDIKTQLKKMVLWLIANPKKKKSNYLRFITNWLGRSQERGGDISSNKASQQSINDQSYDGDI